MSTQNETYNLSELDKALIDLLKRSGVDEDGMVGTMLLLIRCAKEEEKEDWALWLYDNHPTPKQITEKLINWVRDKCPKFACNS